MAEVTLEWISFKDMYKMNKISVDVDLNKGHALMASEVAPKSWRNTIKTLRFFIVLSILSGLILFFFVKWWIPIIIFIVSGFLSNAIRKESAKAVVETSLNNITFYHHAVESKTLTVRVKDNTKG
jgi:hypothetical protein